METETQLSDVTDRGTFGKTFTETFGFMTSAANSNGSIEPGSLLSWPQPVRKE